MLPILKIYTCFLENPLEEDARQRFIKLLPEDRQAKIKAKKNTIAADESLIGEILARYALSNELLKPLKEIEIRHTEKGMPYIEGDLFFISITHSHGFVACAVSDSPVGIDAEKLRYFSEGVARRMFNENEHSFIESSDDKTRSFYMIWTLKESYLKAIGTGISFPMKNLEFTVKDGSISFNLDNNAKFRVIESIDGYILSVCRIAGSNKAHIIEKD